MVTSTPRSTGSITAVKYYDEYDFKLPVTYMTVFYITFLIADAFEVSEDN